MLLDLHKGYDECRDLKDLKSFPEVKSMGINDGLDFMYRSRNQGYLLFLVNGREE